ncbi:MAG: hypothetical protein PHS34_09550, partial [Candidatus Omnitrophica bacterium]|nr:hypothetical protein [Candidatus Omnitrophota bacterium]
MSYTKEQRAANAAKKAKQSLAPQDDRVSREQTVREAEPVHEAYAEWEDDSMLNTRNIPPRPGYVQRWVRTLVKGQEDQANVFKKYNKGWKPRPLSSVPKGQFVMHVDFNGIDVIGIHGMILMERPKALQDRQKAAIEEETRLQMSAVKQNMYREHDPRSGITRPEMTEQTNVTRGRNAF